MSDEAGGRAFSLAELFVVKFVLADIVIIAALLFAGPLYAVAITALLVISIFLVWFLTTRVDRQGGGQGESTSVGGKARERGTDATVPGSDPVTRLQERYAAGELTETEFETKLERLIEANERAERAGIETTDLEFERERPH